MTPTDIDSMPAGPEMDAMVVEKVMGGSLDHQPDDDPKFYGVECLKCGFDLYYKEFRAEPCIPPYSTSDAAALEVFKKLVADGVIDTIQFGRSGSESPQWEVGKYDYEWMGAPGAEAHTLALAICRAALKATAGAAIIGKAEPDPPVLGRLIWSCGPIPEHKHDTEIEALECRIAALKAMP